MNDYPKVFLKKGKEASIKRFHPWVFSGAIQKIPSNIREGDIVEVFSEQGEYLATGHYQPDSISVRILSFSRRIIDQHFWQEKLQLAIKRRYDLGFFENNNTNVFRLVHGEGDFLPGLVADYYNGLVVVQFHSAGMYYAKEFIVQALRNILPHLKAIYNKSSNTLPFQIRSYNNDGFLWGEVENPLLVKENGYSFVIDYKEGQKTGFFIDQREHRMLVASFCKNKRVANLFGYTGGFAIYASKHGAFDVVNVDSSEKALDIAVQNYKLNNCNNIKNIGLEVNDFFKQTDTYYDVIVLDPPAFAKHHIHKEKALIAYKNINAKALKIINSGGILFSFSCSQAISAIELKQAIFVAAANSGRNISILFQLHQPPDHPVNIYHPEGDYLKGFVLRVD